MAFCCYIPMKYNLFLWYNAEFLSAISLQCHMIFQKLFFKIENHDVIKDLCIHGLVYI